MGNSYPDLKPREGTIKLALNDSDFLHIQENQNGAIWYRDIVLPNGYRLTIEIHREETRTA